MGVFHIFQIAQMVPNRAKHHIYTVSLYNNCTACIIVHLTKQFCNSNFNKNQTEYILQIFVM